ncbi:Uncharacterised protein [Mycobacteroides abscessus subsp. abscessus]|nr:Uncharacterised protein [Mycobacteroides abscessus subsp. abscessus]
MVPPYTSKESSMRCTVIITGADTWNGLSNITLRQRILSVNNGSRE